MLNQRHYYRINVSQSQSPQTVFETFIDWTRFSSSPDLLRLEFKLFKAVESVWVQDDCDVGVIYDQTIKLLKAEEPLMVPRDKVYSDQSRSMIRGILSSMHVPEEEQPHLIMQLFHGIKLVLIEQNVRGLASMPSVVFVDIYDVTLQLQNINDDQTSV